MATKTRKTDWTLYRRASVMDGQRPAISSLGDKKLNRTKDDLMAGPSDGFRRDAMLKEIEIRNSSAPPSVGERHYKKEFRIGESQDSKKEESEE